MLTARDKKLKLAGKSLTEHVRQKHGAGKEVGAALMPDGIRKDDNPIPHQTMTKYTKSLSREERVMARFPEVEQNILESLNL